MRARVLNAVSINKMVEQWAVFYLPIVLKIAEEWGEQLLELGAVILLQVVRQTLGQ